VTWQSLVNEDGISSRKEAGRSGGGIRLAAVSSRAIKRIETVCMDFLLFPCAPHRSIDGKRGPESFVDYGAHTHTGRVRLSAAGLTIGPLPWIISIVAVVAKTTAIDFQTDKQHNVKPPRSRTEPPAIFGWGVGGQHMNIASGKSRFLQTSRVVSPVFEELVRLDVCFHAQDFVASPGRVSLDLLA
jgi:hypothetical protein